MSKLAEFLAKRDTSVTEEVKISDKIPFPFTIRALTSDEFTQIQKECNKPMKKGKMEFDSAKFNEKVILAGCVDPDFRKEGDVKAAGCVTPAQYIKRVLLPGEMSNLVSAISVLSGFDKDIEDLKEEAKNS